MFETLMQYNESVFSSCGTNCPVENVSWHEAAAFANALSGVANRPECYSCTYGNQSDPTTVSCTESGSYGGQNIYNCPGYRLPTDAEWEYVSRATNNADLWTTNGGGNVLNVDDNNCQPGVSLTDGSLLSSFGWYCANANGSPHDIAQKTANGFDVFDMHGNVFEWCQDWYDVWWQVGVNPINTSGTTKLIRGGSWDSEPYELRATYRDHNYPTYRSSGIGFRLVRTGP